MLTRESLAATALPSGLPHRAGRRLDIGKQAAHLLLDLALGDEGQERHAPGQQDQDQPAQRPADLERCLLYTSRCV